MKFPIFTVLACLPLLGSAQLQYQYTADLKNITNDQVSVNLIPPQLKEESLVFSFAMAIPGSYARKDFGRFIDDLAAYDKNGKSIKWKKINANQFSIPNSSGISRITYKVNDTWDKVHENFIFQPGGSNIEQGTNFVINNHAFFGYFEGYTSIPVEVKFIKPADLYGATHLTVNRKDPDQDILSAKNFFTLADNPIIYAKADTTSFMAGKTRINVAVYSATGKVKSATIAGFLKPTTYALDKFFNGLPVDSYQFLYFFGDPKTALIDREKGQGGYGALEHNYSSLYYLPEIPFEPQLRSLVNEVSGHEFLHILTPLNLHSEEIEKFDFSSPKMSKHLWLYEGVTEYFANLVLLQNGLLSQKEFFKNMRDKINQAEEYGNFSMTEMSANVMADDYQKKYNSVYNRGALIAFMLDMQIREKTQGRKDLKSVIQQLAKKYGPSKPFKDDNLFAEIIEATDPSISNFIAQYIAGGEALPFTEFFSKLGYEYQPFKEVPAYYAGDLALKYDENGKTFIFSDVKDNSLGLKNGDVFFKLKDITLSSENVNEVWDKYFQSNTTDPELSVTIRRNGEMKVLSGKLNTGYYKIKNYLAPATFKTEQQDMNLRHICDQVFVGVSGY